MRNQAISKMVIAVTFFILAVTAGLYFLSKKSSTGPVALKTYTNSIYDISFDYPATYDLTETSKSDKEGGPGVVVTLTDKGISIPKNGEGPTAITVGMYDNSSAKDVKQSPAIAWIKNSPSSNFHLSKQDVPGETRIGEKEAWLYTWSGLYEGTSVVTEHKNNIIMFTVTYDGDKDMKKRRDFTTLIESVRWNDATPTGTTTNNS